MSSDGTTAVQVSPIPTESEMASIRQIFTNVANALVRASELAKQVTELELRFATLNEDHTRVMARSDQLEQSLSEARAQRDEAMTERDQAQRTVSELTSEIGIGRNALADATQQIEQLKTAVAAVSKDRDEAMVMWHRADTDAAEAEAKLKAIKAAMGIVDPPKPEPVPPQAEPIPEARPLSEAEVASAQPESPSDHYTPPPYTWGDPNKF